MSACANARESKWKCPRRAEVLGTFGAGVAERVNCLTQVLGTELRSPGRAASVLSHPAVSFSSPEAAF